MIFPPLSHIIKRKQTAGKKKSSFSRFLDQFKDAMILILIAAVIVSCVIACMEGIGCVKKPPLETGAT